MSKDSVRYGRVPKRSREKLEESSVILPEKSETPYEPYKPSPNMLNLVSTIVEAFRVCSNYSQEKTNMLVRKPFLINLPDQSQTFDIQRILVWQQIATSITPTIEQVVEFAKRLPGFIQLAQDEQLMCIKSGIFEVWMIHASRVIGDDGVTFCDGTYVTRQQMEIVFDRTFMDMFFNFARWLNDLQLSETLLSVYSSVVLITPERLHQGIDRKNVKLVHDQLLEALRYQCMEEFPTEPHLYSALVSRLPELLSFGGRLLESLRWFREHWRHAKISALFAEVYDIPNTEFVER